MRKGETVNGKMYMCLDILRAKLTPFMEIRETDTFQQAGAPAHTCKTVKNRFATQRFNLLERWPENSADLNPIENLWSFLKSKVSEKETQFDPNLGGSLQDFSTIDISPAYCEKLISNLFEID